MEKDRLTFPLLRLYLPEHKMNMFFFFIHRQTCVLPQAIPTLITHMLSKPADIIEILTSLSG